MARAVGYPFFATANALQFATKLARGKARWTDFPRAVTKTIQRDWKAFLVHSVIFGLSEASMSTYSDVESHTADLAPAAPVVVIDGFKDTNPLRGAVRPHFERLYASNPNAHLVELPSAERELYGALAVAYEIAEKLGPLALIEVHADTCPGIMHINSDCIGSNGIAEVPKMMALRILERQGILKGLDATGLAEKKRELADQIRSKMMAKNGQVILYGCSILNGSRGEEMAREVGSTFLSQGGEVVGPGVDLYRDYSDYLLSGTSEVIPPAGLAVVHATSRYFFATAYLTAHTYKTLERGGAAWLGTEEEFDPTFSAPAVRRLAVSPTVNESP